VNVTGLREQTGEAVAVVLGKEDLQASLPRRTDGPAFLLSLYHERYEAWARSVLQRRRRQEMPDSLIDLLIDSSLGVTPRRKYLLQTDPAVELLGEWNFDGCLALADVLPAPDVGDESAPR